MSARDGILAALRANRPAGDYPLPPVPTCFAMAWLRPSSFGEAPRAASG